MAPAGETSGSRLRSKGNQTQFLDDRQPNLCCKKRHRRLEYVELSHLLYHNGDKHWDVAALF